jgi:hypothetical protein
MQGNNAVTMGEAVARGQRHASETPDKKGVGKVDIEALKAKLREYQPSKELSKLDVIRELFDILEEKRKAGATPVDLAQYLSAIGWEVSEATLKTLMSKVRRESKIEYVKCPCCQSTVSKAQISGHFREFGASETASGADV